MASAVVCIAVVVAAGDHPALLRLGSQTLLARAVATARAADGVDHVIVLADSAAVVREAAAAGVTARRVAGRGVTDDEAVIESLSTVADDAAVVVLLDPAAALIEPGDVAAVLGAVTDRAADCAVAVLAARGAFLERATAPPEPVVAPPDMRLTVDIGALRALRLGPWRAASARLIGTVATVPLPPERLLRADGPGGIEAVAAILGARGPARGCDRLPARPAALIMDFDGVFTDNRVLVDQDGREAVLCNRSDGMGLEQLRDRGLPMLVLSKEKNPVVAARCAKLKLACLQAIDDKAPALLDWCRERHIDPEAVIYIGNDTNDLPCFALVGCAVAVADAHPAALAAADMVLTRAGGMGALRELTDLITERLDGST